MKRGKTRKPQIAFKAPEEMKDYVVNLAEALNLNVSDVLREAVEIYRSLREAETEWRGIKHRALADERPLNKIVVELVQAGLRHRK